MTDTHDHDGACGCRDEASPEDLELLEAMPDNYGAAERDAELAAEEDV